MKRLEWIITVWSVHTDKRLNSESTKLERLCDWPMNWHLPRQLKQSSAPLEMPFDLDQTDWTLSTCISARVPYQCSVVDRRECHYRNLVQFPTSYSARLARLVQSLHAVHLAFLSRPLTVRFLLYHNFGGAEAELLIWSNLCVKKCISTIRSNMCPYFTLTQG